ncbi:helix-turn-helix domain-containing protein [Microbacterium phyllosphaerae]|uniref:helix-turn-helix domain-containing protein n=1 Tax=Microbacterium phyllosphaerae TaxID=124798 RepID=UPI001AE42ED0
MTVHEQFASLERSGLSARQIAQICGVSSRTVVRWRQATGHSHRPATTPVPRTQLERALLLLEDGASISEAARSIGCSNKTISKRWPQYAWSQSQAGRFAAMVARAKRGWIEEGHGHE